MRSTRPLRGRYRADFPAGTVVFLIGMRINSFRSLRSWFPVFLAMPKMLGELFRQPELGLLGARTWMGWRVVMVQQYWASMDALMAYAASRDAEHLPAWRAFNRRACGGGTTGIWHEAYIVDPATSHIVYANMPPFGMGAARRNHPACRPRPSAAKAVPTPIRGGRPGRLCSRGRSCIVPVKRSFTFPGQGKTALQDRGIRIGKHVGIAYAQMRPIPLVRRC